MFKFYKNLFFWTFFTSIVDGEGGGEAEGGEGEGNPEGGEGDEQITTGKIEEKTEDVNIDWRSDLDEDLKKTADRFTSKADAIRAIQAFQKRDSQIRVPGKDSSKEEIATYHKAIGIPETAEGYEFPAPPEGTELTDDQKESRAEWGTRFHKLGISKDSAKELIELAATDKHKSDEFSVKADEKFAKEQEDALRSEWKGDDYDKNITLANRAVAEIAERAGLRLDDLTKIEMKDGRFLLDRPEMSKLFAVIGREMAEGTLGGVITDGERDTIDDAITDIQTKIDEAQAAGKSKEANKLYSKKMGLISKRDGNSNIVGSQGRAA